MKVKDIFEKVLVEVDRIVSTAHPDYYKNNTNKWLAVIMEEVGEIARAENDKDAKNFEEECIQTIAAILLMLKLKQEKK